MRELTEHGQRVLDSCKARFELSPDATIEQCLAAFLRYDETHKTLTVEESLLMTRLLADIIIKGV